MINTDKIEKKMNLKKQTHKKDIVEQSFPGFFKSEGRRRLSLEVA